MSPTPPGPTQAPVKAFFETTFVSNTQAHWVAWFEDLNIAFAPVNDLRQGADDPQARSRQMIVEDGEGSEHIGIPIKFNNEPGSINFAAPTLGQHNVELAQGAGFDEQEIVQMLADGVFGGAAA